LRDIFKTRSCKEWLDFSVEKNTPIAPVNTPQTIVDDPQFQDRFRWMPHEKHGADMLSFPVKFQGETLLDPERAPTVGEHSNVVLREVLGYSEEKIQALEQSGALGKARG
jgi:crotonobetainyl-CoA:carnitine CoA-transferase CaiB-like acyl-CoA transferase